MTISLEFKKGDEVHFKGYDAKPIKSRVIEAKIGRRMFGFELEEQYTLEGISDSLKTVGNGRSIIESRNFRDFPAIKDDSFNEYYKPLPEKYHHLIKPGYAWKALTRRELEI